MAVRTCLLIVSLLLAVRPSSAQPAAPQVTRDALDRLIGATVTAVRVTSRGIEVRDAQVESLTEIKAGEPLTASAVRRTVVQLMGLGTYLDVRIRGEAVDAGVRVDIDLVPLGKIGRLVFSGDTALPERVLREAVTLRFGALPPLGRATDVARSLEEVYRDHGYLRASVQPRPLDDPAAAPGDLVLDIVPGKLAVVREFDVRGAPADAVRSVRSNLGLRPGDPYQPSALRRRLAADVAAFQAAGYLEAQIDMSPRVSESGDGVELAVVVARGPLVKVAFAGDPLPERERAALVPVASEASADEDLLEDSQFRIERYLRTQGYRDARAPFTRDESDGVLTIVYTVTRGPLYRVAAIALRSSGAGGLPDQNTLVRLKPGDPFVQDTLDAETAAVAADLRRRGFTRASVTPLPTLGARPDGTGAIPVTVVIDIAEGPRAIVSGVVFEGTRVLADEQLAQFIRTKVGSPYYRPTVESDVEQVLAEYRNRGHRTALVDAVVDLSASGDEARVRFVVREGPQVIVDHILIVGNTRTSEATIRRELALRPGDALGDAAVAESQRRLAALGLFRRSTISELEHATENLRDVLVTVEEAPATTVGYGGGLEFQKVESREFAPRGFMEVGRRNLWGKNRSVNLFGRVSLRRRDAYEEADEQTGTETHLEYRVIGSYREPRFLNTRGDLQVAAVFEQGSRTSFRYRHESARMNFVERRGGGWSYIGQFAVERNEIYDDQINPADQPLIDRLFPTVRLSSVAATLARDTRSDPLEPGSGELLSVNGEVALPALGSEVGYFKTFLQVFSYRRLPRQPRLVLASGVRVGLGTGFPRDVEVEQPDGSVVVETVRDVPASKRFFAGGDTTVRGFQLDHLGTVETFDQDGVPIGGHAEIILNTEARLALWKDLGVVGFLDVGNVFPRVDAMSLTDLRGAAGFGIRYKSPIGPLRVDIGFKFGTLRTYGTTREDRYALHISLGQAF